MAAVNSGSPSVAPPLKRSARRQSPLAEAAAATYAIVCRTEQVRAVMQKLLDDFEKGLLTGRNWVTSAGRTSGDSWESSRTTWRALPKR